MSWVGRSIHRLEDPALVRGDGRFTGDLKAANWVRATARSGLSAVNSATSCLASPTILSW